MVHPGLVCWEGLKATADPSASLGMTAFLIGWYAARHPEGTRPRPFKASPKRGSEVSHPCGKNKNAGPEGSPMGHPYLGGWEGLKSNRRSFGRSEEHMSELQSRQY